MYGFRKWSESLKEQRKSLSLLGLPRGERKLQVLVLPRTPQAEVVGHSSLSARQGNTNAHGTAQETGRMNGCAVSAIPPPLRCAPSRSHAPLLSTSRTEKRRQKPWGLSPCWEGSVRSIPRHS